MIKINYKKRYISIPVLPHFDYDITFAQLKIEGKDKWLKHLSEKNWFTESLKAEFIKILDTFGVE